MWDLKREPQDGGRPNSEEVAAAFVHAAAAKHTSQTGHDTTLGRALLLWLLIRSRRLLVILRLVLLLSHWSAIVYKHGRIGIESYVKSSQGAADEHRERREVSMTESRHESC